MKSKFLFHFLIPICQSGCCTLPLDSCISMPVFKTEMQTINGAAKGCNCSVTNVLCCFFHGWVTTTPTDLCFLSSLPVCPPPTEPENGGYRCHPSPCHQLTQKTVIEYFCDEGFALKGGYRFLTCQNGEWDGPMQISCRLTQGPVWCTEMGKKPTSCVFTLLTFFCLSHREGTQLSTWNTSSVHRYVHGQLCDPHPAFSRVVCFGSAETQVFSSQQVQ